MSPAANGRQRPSKKLWTSLSFPFVLLFACFVCYASLLIMVQAVFSAEHFCYRLVLLRVYLFCSLFLLLQSLARAESLVYSPHTAIHESFLKRESREIS